MCFIKIELTTWKAIKVNRFTLGLNLKDEIFAMTYLVLTSHKKPLGYNLKMYVHLNSIDVDF